MQCLQATLVASIVVGHHCMKVRPSSCRPCLQTVLSVPIVSKCRAVPPSLSVPVAWASHLLLNNFSILLVQGQAHSQGGDMPQRKRALTLLSK